MSVLQNTSPLPIKITPFAIKLFVGLIILVSTAGLVYAKHSQLFSDHRNPTWAMPISLPGSNNFYQVSSALYRSAQPSAEAFKNFEKLGIKTVLSLRSAGADLELIKNTNLNLVEFPMQSGNINDQIIIDALRLINDSPKPVLVHCHRGADRTGTVVAAYRIVVEGWDKEAAIDELINGGFDFNNELTGIPEYFRHMNMARIKAAVAPDDSF